MTRKLSILISSAGRRGQLIECFRQSARALGVDLRVLVADARPELSAASQLADAAFAVPPCKSQEFVPALRDICRRESVRLVVPTIDPELEVLSVEREQFAAEGTEISVSAPQVVALAADKERTAKVLLQAGVRTPRTVSAEAFALQPNVLIGPLILKPRGGSSSVGVTRPQSVDEATSLARNRADLVVQECWIGREFTVNLYFDFAGQLRAAVPHWRIETRGGEVSKGRTEDVAALREIARKLANVLRGARGALCFQAIQSAKGEFAVFEINARFGGGYPLAHHAGATFTQWLLEEVLGLRCTANDTWRANVTMLRYDAAVFQG